MWAASSHLGSAPLQRGSAPLNRAVTREMPNRDDTNGADDRETPESAARYIASLTGELSKIAKRNGLETLSHLLDMARLEADQATKH
jgi:hypothetical protein